MAAAEPANVAEVLSNISNIMGSTNRLGDQHHALNQQLHELGKPSNFIFPKANVHLQLQSLPILDNLVRDQMLPVSPVLGQQC